MTEEILQVFATLYECLLVTHRMSHELINTLIHHECHELIHAVCTGVGEKDILHESQTHRMSHKLIE